MKQILDGIKVVIYLLVIVTLVNINTILREPLRLDVVGVIHHVLPQQNKNNNDKFNSEPKTNRKEHNI